MGTKFLIEGYNGRVELLHEKIGLLEGAFGFESQYNEFSALGEEAFLPQVDNAVNSVFIFEEIPVDQLRFQFGARYDHQSNETKTDANFGPGLSRDFNGFSTSGGIVYQPVEDYALALSSPTPSARPRMWNSSRMVRTSRPAPLKSGMRTWTPRTRFHSTCP